LVAARFRAVECRRALARAVNMGISAVIDGNGRLVAMPGPTWAQSKDVATVVTAAIPIDTRSSLYVCWGDVLPWTSAALVAIGFIVSRRRVPKP
jgi:apolipoprotein N-acyltransferase